MENRNYLGKPVTLLLAFLLIVGLSPVYGQSESKHITEGREYFLNKQFDKALKSFRKEFKKNPTNEVKFWIANTHAEMKEILLAKPLFLEIVQNKVPSPEYSMSIVNLGNCYRTLNRMDSAHFYYDKAINEFPKMALGFFNKAQLLYQQNKFEDARLNFDKAIEIESKDWYYYQKRLEVCFATKDYNCALHDLIKVRQLNSSVKIEMNLAMCYSLLKRYQEADSVFQLIYNPTDAVFLNNYGMNKHNLGKSKEGQELIKKSLIIDPNNAYAYRNLGLIAVQENDNTKACEYLKKAKSLRFENFYGNEVNELLIKHCNN